MSAIVYKYTEGTDMLTVKQQQKCIEALGYFDGITEGYTNEMRASMLCEYTEAVIAMHENGCFCPMGAMVAASLAAGLHKSQIKG